MEQLLKMLRITNTPTVPTSDDDVPPEADEPPDDKVPELQSVFRKADMSTRKSSAPGMTRRESLLTRAIQAGHDTSPTSPRMSEVPRGLSTTSSHSFASTAELTSDVESPLRSASPSPPPPLHRLQLTSSVSSVKPVDTDKVVIAPINRDDKSVPAETGEAAVEKTLGRKRCIMFAACKDTPSDSATDPEVKTVVPEVLKVEPTPRKSRISFACPSRPSHDSGQSSTVQEPSRRQSSPAPVSRHPSEQSTTDTHQATEAQPSLPVPTRNASIESQPLSPFHEFASSQGEDEEWIKKANEVEKPKLTIDDCLQKENAIRKLGKEAEEEAEAEEREQEELDNELNDDDAGEDDFAPSDDGNESDDEEGFAESDSESDASSDYQFWAPSTTTTRATSTDNMTHFSARATSRSRASSTSSGHSSAPNASHARAANQIKASRAIKMRPGTPELPDSTDFVCGTLDEDRPLEAAFLSCREQKRREKHILIPQDIDPSFPTTDPEDEIDDDDDDVAESSDHIWIKGQFEGFNEDSRGRRQSAFLISPLHSPTPVVAPPRQAPAGLPLRPTRRSPPPKQILARSPAPRRLFDHAQRRLRSPPPAARLRSPRGSPTNTRPMPFGITTNHLAQRPNAVKTSSLPHTPNPFFRNWRNGIQPTSSRITSNAITPIGEEIPSDIHVRGPVDIVIGLEKKRQKRKEKYWRQHARKVAKEQAEKRPPPGRGAERMKELGLECAERTRGYGLGQPAQLVLSL